MHEPCRTSNVPASGRLTVQLHGTAQRAPHFQSAKQLIHAASQQLAPTSSCCNRSVDGITVTQLTDGLRLEQISDNGPRISKSGRSSDSGMSSENARSTESECHMNTEPSSKSGQISDAAEDDDDNFLRSSFTPNAPNIDANQTFVVMPSSPCASTSTTPVRQVFLPSHVPPETTVLPTPAAGMHKIGRAHV